MDKHIVYHWTSLKKYTCCECGYILQKFECRPHFTLVHWAQRPNESIKYTKKQKFKCAYCGRQFRNINNLTEHIRDPAYVRTKMCPLCGMDYADRGSLSYHMNTKHKHHFKCTVAGCNEGFGTETLRDKHSLRCQSKWPKFKKFQLHLNEPQHMQEIKSYKCIFCRSSHFVTEYELDQHIFMSHKSEIPVFSCDQCHKSYWSNSQLAEHKRRAHNYPPPVFNCDQCWMSFHLENQLDEHKRNVHTIQCKYCSNFFFTTAARTQHESVCPYQPAGPSWR